MKNFIATLALGLAVLGFSSAAFAQDVAAAASASAVAEVVVEHFRPIRAKAMELLEDEKHLIDLLHEGAEKARAVASMTLQDTYKNLGLVK
jgi:hypothetical protein